MTQKSIPLSPVTEKFILHWGEMGARWGINRTVAQIHALLYLSPRPLNAEQIAATLEVARSNVSTSLRELQGWGVVKLVHVLGDRRAHFESLRDVWQMFQIIVDERKRREVDPTLTLLRECVAESEADAEAPATLRERLLAMLSFFEAMNSAYDELRSIPVAPLQQLVTMTGSIRKLLAMGEE